MQPKAHQITTAPLITTRALSKTFRSDGLETPVLHDIDLDVAPGEYVAIMGPSGCGKSTLMHILGLMLAPSAGSLLLAGQDVSKLNDPQRARLRREKIGFVFQRFNLLPTVSAYQNVALAERIRGQLPDGQVDRVLAEVGLAHRARYKPGRLSIGQQQRVAIARAIVHHPDILLADEPTGSLDSENSDRVLELFRKIHHDHGLTILLVTHSPEVAAAAQRTIRLADGRVQP